MHVIRPVPTPHLYLFIDTKDPLLIESNCQLYIKQLLEVIKTVGHLDSKTEKISIRDVSHSNRIGRRCLLAHSNNQYSSKAEDIDIQTTFHFVQGLKFIFIVRISIFMSVNANVSAGIESAPIRLLGKHLTIRNSINHRVQTTSSLRQNKGSAYHLRCSEPSSSFASSRLLVKMTLVRSPSVVTSQHVSTLPEAISTPRVLLVLSFLCFQFFLLLNLVLLLLFHRTIVSLSCFFFFLLLKFKAWCIGLDVYCVQTIQRFQMVETILKL